LHRMRLYTLPDFFQQRYGGRWPRIIAALAAIACSFTYVVAQIYGIGLIASRLTGVQFEIGILLGLGGVLLCSFLGGMRAITWTQVAQYIILLLAFLIPVSWLAYKQLGSPLAATAYGEQIARISQLEKVLMTDPVEQEVREIFAQRAWRYAGYLEDVPGSLQEVRLQLQERVRQLQAQGADFVQIAQARRALQALPQTPDQARELWTLAYKDALERAQPLGVCPSMRGLTAVIQRDQTPRRPSSIHRGSIFWRWCSVSCWAPLDCHTCSPGFTPRPQLHRPERRWHGPCSSLHCSI